ncbi:CD63 antigen, partial [Silurus asotus]
LCGLAVIVVGVLVESTLKNLPEVEQTASKGTSAVIIVIGVIIFLVAFFGCCGAWKENYCMVTTFVVLLSLILIAEILLVIGGYVLTNTVTMVMDEAMKSMIKEYKTDPKLKEKMDNLNQEMQCCGVKNASDWVNFKPDNISVPDSCCKNVTVNCGAKAMKDSNKIYTEGCGTVLQDVLKGVMLWVGVGVLVIGFIEILGIVLACTLMYGIRKGFEV